MVIQHNIMSINSHRQLGINNANLGRNLEKLSSGYRINRAADDAAGLAISEKMRAQITGLDRATMNAKDAVSLIQTAEGALTETHAMLNRMVELATQSANGTIVTADRAKITSEMNELKQEITRIATSTKFNELSLLDGTQTFTFQVGDKGSDTVTLNIASMGAGTIGVAGVDVSTRSAANSAIATIKSAIETVSGARSTLGAKQNRLEHAINNLGVTHENMTAAESRIRDVDMAKEMMQFTKNNVLAQAAQSMLAQANQQPQQVLQLLR